MNDYPSSCAEQVSVYPGRYERLSISEEGSIPASPAKGGRPLRPSVEVSDLTEIYRIEMQAPGFRREDFLVQVRDRSLAVSAVNRGCGSPFEKSLPDDPPCASLEMEIDLPGDVDTEFGIAEYRNGKLYVHLQKTSFPLEKTDMPFVVY